MVVGENKRTNIMDGIENTGDVRLHDHRLRLKQRFDIVRKLGQGTYGKVQLGINKKTGQEVAIKTIKKCKIESEADLVRIRREVQIMSSVRHPNIVHIYEVFENSEKMILVMEYCSGGELYDYLSQKKVLQEEEARRLFRQIATAVYYCHIHKICHRDLKLENVLIDDTGSAKIADFGLSNVFKETSLLSTFCGSPLYASPEIVKGTPYIGPEVDCWSLGVLLYTLVYGAMPFDGSNFKRLVRQISNGDYYEPKVPSTASPLIRDMLTVDPLKRADIAYICDHPWVNTGCETCCLEMAEALAAQTPVRLDLLLSLAPAAQPNTNSVMVPNQSELGPEESCTDLTSSTSMAVEPSNSAEKRILDLVAEGGEDAIKPSPTRTIVSADNKRKLELAMSASGLHKKKERVASSASIAPQAPAVPEESPLESPPEQLENEQTMPLTLKSSATMTISPAPVELVKDLTREIVKEVPKEEETKEITKPKVAKKISPKVEEKALPENEEQMEEKPSSVSSAADKLTSLSLTQLPAQTVPKPKKLSIPGGTVGSFKDQFERRASLTSTPEVKRAATKPVVSKIAKPKAQSEDRELSSKSTDNGSVRLQQIGIEPTHVAVGEEQNRGGVKKTESEPSHSTTSVDPSVLLQDARRSLQNSMAKLVEEKVGEDSRRRAARDIISSAIRTGKPPVPYGRSSSAGVTSLSSPAAAPAPAPAPSPAPAPAPKVFRTEAHHVVDDYRNAGRGVSVERIIPIQVSDVSPPSPSTPATLPQPPLAPIPAARSSHTPIRRLISNESAGSAASEASSTGEPIKKSAREFIIPIAVEGKGFVTPRQKSLEPEPGLPTTRHVGRLSRPKRFSSLVSGGESEEEDDTHSMHRLRSTRAARAESVSSGEEDEEDEGFHLLTADNLFSTLLHRVRALTNRLNGEEGPGFSQHQHSLFNNLQSPFFNSPHLPRRHLLREGWDLHSNLDSMFNKSRQQMPRGSSKSRRASEEASEGAGEEEVGLDLSDLDLSGIAWGEREVSALSGLTPALSRRLQRQLLAHLPPRAARRLRRTLSLHAPPPAPHPAQHPQRSHSACKTAPTPDPTPPEDNTDTTETHFSTLPRLKCPSRETTPISTENDYAKIEPNRSRASSVRSTPDRSLLSKYLTPERNPPLDNVESFSSENGSILSEPSYIAAYGAGLRRHSMRLVGEQPRKRVSRFLRSDFFDTPPDESVYAKHKKEKELETQKILKEIREKRNKSLDSSVVRSPVDSSDAQIFKDDLSYRKCLSPISILAAKERSRSNTPFFPILDNIKETNVDTSQLKTDSKRFSEPESNNKSYEDMLSIKESKLTRPKSYPVKTNTDASEEQNQNSLTDNSSSTGSDVKETSLPKESKLIRPKSYPTTSPSPEKVFVSRNTKKDEVTNGTIKEPVVNPEKTDIEVSFSVTLPRKSKPTGLVKQNSLKNSETIESKKEPVVNDRKTPERSIVLKKYKIINHTNSISTNESTESKDNKPEKGSSVQADVENGKTPVDNTTKTNKEETTLKVVNHASKIEAAKLKPLDKDGTEKKGTIKKKIIKKVSSKSKTDSTNSQDTNESKPVTEKKKTTKKVKEKSTENGTKTTTAPKKKSVLQSIGQKFEKFTSSKSNSNEKVSNKNSEKTEVKTDSAKSRRMQREQSVPVASEPPTESNLIKRAVTLTDVAALDSQQSTPNKTTVSKVLGLFKKFEPKEKLAKPVVEITPSPPLETVDVINIKEPIVGPVLQNQDNDKPKRPTSLLLNGLGGKSKYGRTTSESMTDNEDQSVLKKDNDSKRNSLKLDFSRLPRVKKIVPTNPVIEPQMMNVSSFEKKTDKKDVTERNGTIPPGITIVNTDLSRSRSRSRSTFSNSENLSAEIKPDTNPLAATEISTHRPMRNHESTTPEKEDIIERIRRKSFYSRFNEKKQRRKSSLVGPGAAEYDPVARLHSQPVNTKYDVSPTSPVTYDSSPGYSMPTTDLSPSTERYRSLLSDLPSSSKNKFDNYGLNDKIDTYRSLDRKDYRKYPGSRSYLDYDPTSYGTHRYSRTKSLLDSSDETDDHNLSHLRDPLKYNRTISMYSPGNYATYRPKRTRNSAIILKESEKEPSPENILDKIRQRKKISISVTTKPYSELDPVPRSTDSSKGEGNGTECSEKTD